MDGTGVAHVFYFHIKIGCLVKIHTKPYLHAVTNIFVQCHARNVFGRSFGVMLWEIMTLGRTPYPGVENRELLEQIEEKGLKLSKPKPCPNVM